MKRLNDACLTLPGENRIGGSEKKLKDVLNTIVERKLRWMGHVVRPEERRWSNEILNGCPTDEWRRK